MPAPARERQQKHRANLRASGNLRTSVTLSQNALTALRQITSEHRVTQSKAIELGILAAAKFLAEGKKDA